MAHELDEHLELPHDVSTAAQVLGDPERLLVLGRLRRAGVETVAELAHATRLSPETVQDHLSLLAGHGVVREHTPTTEADAAWTTDPQHLQALVARLGAFLDLGAFHELH